MKVNFLHYHIEDEWMKLLLINPKLVFITLRFCQLAGGEITITHLYRTEKQQRAFYPDDPNKRSVHEFWRGVDVRTKDLDSKVVAEAVNMLNAEFYYDNKRNTALVHTIGRGVHLHLQTKSV